MVRLLIVLAATLPLLGAPANADCRRVVATRSVVLLQQVQPAYYYSVGAAIQEEALAARIAERVKALLVQPAAATAAPQTHSLVRQNCAGCHGGAAGNQAAKASFALPDSLDQLADEDRVRMTKAILEGKMPKGKTLDSAVIGNLLGQIVGAENAPE